ncbi:MAG: BrnA antitoxin family protein [Solimonas sp.]
MKRVDAHQIKADEYKELPELSDEMLTRAVVNKGGRPRAADPRTLVSIRLPASVLTRWKATGPGWQTRMADVLAKAAR